MADKLTTLKDEVVTPKQEIKKLKDEVITPKQEIKDLLKENGARSLESKLRLENQPILLNILGELTLEIKALNRRVTCWERNYG